MGKTYGYIRVSSTDQNESRQYLAMQKRDIPQKHIFIDKVSGKDFQRPQYLAMLRRLKPGVRYASPASTGWGATTRKSSSSGMCSPRK